MPSLTKRTKIKDNVVIFLNPKAFAYKRDGTVRGGIDIFSHNGSATRAKYRAVLEEKDLNMILVGLK